MFRVGKNWIRIGSKGDVNENRHFIEGKLVAHGQFYGGDVDENRHFIEGKLVAHGQFYEISWGRCD